MTTRPKRLRVALFGSPDFAVPVLDALHARHELQLVVTQPAKPAGRGMKLRQPAAAERALDLGLPLAQPARLKGNADFEAQLRAADLEVAVTAAYGKILPASLLAVPRHGFLNVHASLLPAYRGAAPIQWALIDGRRTTGVTIMQTELGLDTGPIRLQRALDIGPDETAPELFERLSELGVDALLEALDLLARGELPSRPQDDAEASHARLLDREDGRLRFERSARSSYDRYRGVFAWPGTYFEHDGRRVRVDALRPAPGGAGSVGTDRSAPGTVVAVDDPAIVVASGDGALRLERVTPAGKATMDAAAWARGQRLDVGDRVGPPRDDAEAGPIAAEASDG